MNGADRPCVFVHTNHRQYLGALVSQHSLRRNSAHADRFDVRILHTQDFPFLRAREGQEFLRDGVRVRWEMEDLQSFTPLRFAPPGEMGYQGRALVIDPDIFAVGDVWELLSRDMQGKAIWCRTRGKPGRGEHMASSVMLLDNAKLAHWRTEEDFAALFDGRRDYIDWIGLRYERRDTIGLLEPEWNDFDHLTPQTRLLHNTRRRTQPWKTGLPMDFRPARKRVLVAKPATWLGPVRRRLFGDPHESGVYQPHPDREQERFFFGLLRECVDAGVVDEKLLREEMRQNHLRHDALELLDRTPHAAA
ncbi:MAG TPA: hypothetical protein VMW19_09200 [Myxococcota bacterium]|nr:hypothetical protein [Myxococcota bacterium]